MNDNIDAFEKINVLLLIIGQVITSSFEGNGSSRHQVVIGWDIVFKEFKQFLIFFAVHRKIRINILVETEVSFFVITGTIFLWSVKKKEPTMRHPVPIIGGIIHNTPDKVKQPKLTVDRTSRWHAQ